jgi:hypothetical protein
VNRRPADLHADWLRLVEPEGQFLTLPVLRRAFPDGLEAISAAVREQLRERYPRTAAPTQSDWDAWFDWLARDALAWGPHYRCGEEAAAYTHAVPEYGVVLRADAALCDPRNPRALVMRYPHGTPLDHRLAGERWNASPVDRLTLLCRAQHVRIGLLTDGERVMLVWVPGAGAGGHATWETALFTESRERNLFQSFVSLLHASRFFAVREDQQLEALFEASEKAQNQVTGQLGLQVRQAVELLVSALSRADLERGGALLSGISPHRVYEAAATVMMRLVFLLYAEERDLLPLADPLYAEHYAASTLCEQLNEQAAMEGDEPLERRGAAWFRLLALFRIIYAGLSHDRLRIPPYGGRLFDPDRFAFLEGRRAGEAWSDTASRPLPVDDLTVRAILEAIQTLPIRESGSKERRRLSFRSLDVEQIGHVYEGLLDHGAERVDDVYVGLVGKTGAEAEIPLANLEKAAGQGQQPLVSFLHDFTGKSPSAIERLIERGRAVVDGNDAEARRLVNTVCDNNAALAGRVSPFVYALRTDLHGLPVVFPPETLVVKQTRARRDSGTEYTPRELAEEMVRYALEPLAYSPGPKEGAESDRWRLRSSAELLGLKICDPAVGSGAFLVSACRYLADRVVEAWVVEKPERAKENRDDLTLEARRGVVDRCLYGVDRDPMAVEMAKLSLWLITMARERPFSFLDHSICEGDSLIGISSLDELCYLHISPESGRAVHARTHVNATEFVQPLVETATGLRLELESLPNISVRDAEHKQQLNDEANQLLRESVIIADGVVATAISTAAEARKRGDVAFQGFASLVASALASKTDVQRRDAFDRLRSRNEQLLNAGRPENAPPRTPLHWPLAFPEVFSRSRGGFDAMVGNPPFVGGKKISTSFGSDFREYLVADIALGRKGHADLVGYFFLRATTLADSFAFLAVNTIAEGDTREVVLDSLTLGGWRIVRAVKSRPWPGAAGIHISQVWLSRNAPKQQAFLDDVPVADIVPSLSAARRITGNPFRLLANEGIAFIGTFVLGMGFTMPPDEAQRLIRLDKKNSEVLFPYIGAEDVCSRPDLSASRWIVNFHEWSLDKAKQYAECFAYIEERVKPERLSKKGKVYEQARTKWWWYQNRRPGLQKALSGKAQVIVMPLHSKAVLPAICVSRAVFSHGVAVIASNDYSLYGLMTSTLHRAWAKRYGSSLETRTRYTPSDCFETFPFPKMCDKVTSTAIELEALRRAIMIDCNIGLTAVCNRVHNEQDEDARIVELRDLHAELDRAVCDAYGWSDLELDYGFHDTDEGIRWTISEEPRNEILDRLLELNHERHREEQLRGIVGTSGVSTNGGRARARKAPSNDGVQMALAENNGS